MSTFYREELETRMKALSEEEQRIMLQYVADDMLADEWKRRFDICKKQKEEATKSMQNIDARLSELVNIMNPVMVGAINE